MTLTLIIRRQGDWHLADRAWSSKTFAAQSKHSSSNGRIGTAKQQQITLVIRAGRTTTTTTGTIVVFITRRICIVIMTVVKIDIVMSGCPNEGMSLS